MNIQHWFTGMVEDIADPNGMGRVRVRCFGYHVPKSTDADGDGEPDLDTPDLLWAPCLLPIDNPAINGIASSPGALMPGSMVMGFFRDGDDMQDPVVIGGISQGKGYDTEYNNNMGFGDPNNTFSYSSFNEVFPEDSGSFSSINGTSNRYNQYNSSICGQVSPPSVHYSSYEPQDIEPIELNGDIGAIIASAMGDVGLIERGENNNIGLKKYWDSLERPGGYNSRLPYCAAFVSYHIKASGILPPEHCPQTASSTGFESWAQRKPFCKIIYNPKKVEQGDIIKFTHRHVALARAASQGGRIYTVEGNCACPRSGPAPGNEGVWAKDKSLNKVQYVIRIVPQQKPRIEQPSYPPEPAPKNNDPIDEGQGPGWPTKFVAAIPEWDPNLNENS